MHLWCFQSTVVCEKCAKNFNCFFSPIRVFFHRQWQLTGQQRKVRDEPLFLSTISTRSWTFRTFHVFIAAIYQSRFEIASTITIVLQEKRLSKSASHIWLTKCARHKYYPKTETFQSWFQGTEYEERFSLGHKNQIYLFKSVENSM